MNNKALIEILSRVANIVKSTELQKMKTGEKNEKCKSVCLGDH